MQAARPENALGAELVWWREDGHQHTLLTIAGPLLSPRIGASRLVLTFALHDVAGRFVKSWQRTLDAASTLYFDSRTVAAELSALPEPLREGALVVWIAPSPDAPPPSHAEAHARAYAMVDWWSDTGALVTLHTDQSVVARSRALELTEMVFREAADARTTLVIVNGPEEQLPGALSLVLRNAPGEERILEHLHAMAPFSVVKLALAELTPNLIAFCGDADATVAGRFEARGVFTRPYVITEGATPSGYHGGDRYPSRAIDPLVHRTFSFAEARASVPWQMMLVSAQKETNPAYAVHRADLTTLVHLFQSHGDLEEDFFVDATLYDTRGHVVARRERWAIAPRLGQTTCAVAELCGGADFEGHVALGYSDDATKTAFPRRVQALVEYRTQVSVARAMLWSDRWNAPDRVLTQRENVPFRALFRVFFGRDRLSAIAISNASVSADYDREAPYRVRLVLPSGDERVYEAVLAPFATKVATITELFPDLGGDGDGELAVATAIVESAFDLASMHLTRDRRSGVVSAEHLLAIFDRIGSELVVPCGA